MFQKFKQLKHKRIIIGLVVVFVIVALGIVTLIPTGFVQAADSRGATITGGSSSSMGDWVAQFLTWIMTLFVGLAGAILTIFIRILLWIVEFNQFIHTDAVDLGWVVVRDLANIFFVIIMLVIALGTMFNMQSYEYKKILPKLMAAIILVNFSKMIVGLAIDVGQVIMLTFVNAFKVSSPGALVSALKLDAMFKLKDKIEDSGGGAAINYWTMFGSTVLALILIIIAAVVILQLIVILLARIIMLWVLIIFSPIAFVASVLPTSPLQKVSFFAQYWTYLSKYIIIGPILAFFLWLTFGIMAKVNETAEGHIISSEIEAGEKSSAYLATEVSNPQILFDYMVAIGLLVGSLMITKQMGVMGGAMGMNAVSKAKSKAGTMTKKWAKNRAVNTGQRLDRASIKAQAHLGIKQPTSLRPTMRKAAKDAYKQKVEDDVYEKHGVVGGMTDKLNKRWNHEITNNQQLQKDRYVAKIEKDIEDSPSGNDAEALAHQVEHGKLDAPHLEAILKQLMKMGRIDAATDDNSSSFAAVKKVVVDKFGDGDEGKRVMTILGNMGVNSGNVQLAGGTKVNPKTGKFEWQDEEARTDVVANIIRAREGFSAINNLGPDAYPVKNGELTMQGAKVFKETAGQLGSNYTRTKENLRAHQFENVMAFKKFADEQTPEDKRTMYQAIGRMINPNGKGEELFRENDLNNGIINDSQADEIIRQHTTTNKKEINHEEELVNKRETIEKINKQIAIDEQDRERIGRDPNKGMESSEWKQKNEAVKINKQEVEKLQNDIQGEHQPAVAERVVDNLNKDDFGNATEMQQVGEKLAQAVEDALKNIEGGLDFTEATKGLDKFTENLNKELNKIGDDNKKPDLSFAKVSNMNKVNPMVQINMLRKLGEIAKKLGKKAMGEE